MSAHAPSSQYQKIHPCKCHRPEQQSPDAYPARTEAESPHHRRSTARAGNCANAREHSRPVLHPTGSGESATFSDSAWTFPRRRLICAASTCCSCWVFRSPPPAAFPRQLHLFPPPWRVSPLVFPLLRPRRVQQEEELQRRLLAPVPWTREPSLLCNALVSNNIARIQFNSTSPAGFPSEVAGCSGAASGLGSAAAAGVELAGVSSAMICVVATAEQKKCSCYGWNVTGAKRDAMSRDVERRIDGWVGGYDGWGKEVEERCDQCGDDGDQKKKKENGLWRDRQECVHVIYPSIYTGNEARHGLLFFAPFLCLKLFIISVTYPASTRKEKRRGDWTSIRKLLSPTTMIPESHY